MTVETQDARWEAIKNVAQRYGLLVQVVLDHILDRPRSQQDRHRHGSRRRTGTVRERAPLLAVHP